MNLISSVNQKLKFKILLFKHKNCYCISKLPIVNFIFIFPFDFVQKVIVVFLFICSLAKRSLFVSEMITSLPHNFCQEVVHAFPVIIFGIFLQRHLLDKLKESMMELNKKATNSSLNNILSISS